MGAFLSGEYAAQYGDAGMVGYMQSHTPEPGLFTPALPVASNCVLGPVDHYARRF
jgi:hypothetical protein